MNKNKLNFQVLGTMVLVELPVIEKTTKGGIIKASSMIAEEEQKQSNFLTVISIGEDVKTIKKGDKVFIRNSNHPIGYALELNDNKYMLLDVSNVLGKRIR